MMERFSLDRRDGARKRIDECLRLWLARVRERKLLPARFPEDVIPEEDFEKEMRRERARAERTGLPFTMVTFEFPDLAAMPSRLVSVIHRCLATVLVERTRVTDVVGWSRGQLALILPHTPPAEAGRLCEAIHACFREKYVEVSGDCADILQLQRQLYVYDSIDARRQAGAAVTEQPESTPLRAAAHD